MGTIATTVFAQSLSNFTCTFAMMRGGTLLILGHEVKGPGQLLATTVFAQSLSNFTCTFAMMRGGTLLNLGHGSKVKVNFGTLYIKPCGHDTCSDYSFCPITFKLHMHIRHDERRNPIDFGLRSQKSRSTLTLCI